MLVRDAEAKLFGILMKMGSECKEGKTYGKIARNEMEKRIITKNT